MSEVPWKELRRSWVAVSLRQFSKENDIDAFKGTLLELLANAGVLVPKGVLTPWPKKMGAPTKEQTTAIHQRWLALKKPSLYRKTLAESFFGKEFTTVGSSDRKKMIDRCRRAVERIKAAPTKLFLN